MSDRLKELADAGVSIWLDDLSRERINSGNLAELVAELVRGRGDHQPDDLRRRAVQGRGRTTTRSRSWPPLDSSVEDAIKALTTDDVRNACDLFAAIYAATSGFDGRVSIEVEPGSGHGHRRHHRPGRRPVQDRRPAQRADQDPGHQARPAGDHRDHRRGDQRQRDPDLRPRALPRRHRRLPQRSGAGRGQRPRPEPDPLGRLVLRVPGRHRGRQAARRDRLRRGQGAQEQGGHGQRPAGLRRCTRRSSARERFAALEAKGANRQRPLWASTGVKDPDLPDTMYVTELVVANTVNTMPEKTMQAFADHGEVAGRQGHRHRGRRPAGAGPAWPRSASTYDDVVDVLETEGVREVRRLLGRAGRDGADRARRGQGRQATAPAPGARHRRRRPTPRDRTDPPNPLRDPQDRRLPRIAGPCVLVIFGVTGDLSTKKLMPAVYDLANRGLLPPGFALVGFARRDWAHQDFAEIVHDAVKQHARTPFREEVWQQLSEGIRFVPGEIGDDESFAKLAEHHRRPRRGPRHRRQPRVLPVHPAGPVPDRGRPAPLARAGRGARRPLEPGGDREAVRPRPGQRAGAEPDRLQRLPVVSRSSGSTTTWARRPSRT